MYEGVFAENFKGIFVENLKTAFDYVKEIKDYKKYESVYNFYLENYNEINRKCYKPSPKGHGYNVLSHGDFHFKNMMFLTDGTEANEIHDVIFVDFQISNYASPGVDIAYLLNAVADIEWRTETSEFEIIELYYQTFVGLLNKLGFLGKIPTMLDLQMEILRCGPVGK